ncbi:hypothetical protein GCM10020331_024530 [Ectobacillus funiculus]
MPTGLHFYEQTPQSIQEAVKLFEKNQTKFVPKKLSGKCFTLFRRNVFKVEIKSLVEEEYKK